MTQTKLGSSIELSREMILKMHGGHAIATIQSNPCLRARIRAVFIRLVAIALGLSTLLESTFTEACKTHMGRNRGKEAEGSLVHGTGYEARLHAMYTAKLVSVAIGHHANARALFLRLVRRVRRRMRQREALIPTLCKEQRSALLFLHYSKKLAARSEMSIGFSAPTFEELEVCGGFAMGEEKSCTLLHETYRSL